MGTVLSKALTNCTHLKVVPVISSFDCDGNIKPLYVRIGGNSLKIYNAYLAESNCSIFTFRCEIMDHDTVKPLKLSYHVNNFLWSIPAIEQK